MRAHMRTCARAHLETAATVAENDKCKPCVCTSPHTPRAHSLAIRQDRIGPFANPTTGPVVPRYVAALQPPLGVSADNRNPRAPPVVDPASIAEGEGEGGGGEEGGI